MVVHVLCGTSKIAKANEDLPPLRKLCGEQGEVRSMPPRYMGKVKSKEKYKHF